MNDNAGGPTRPRGVKILSILHLIAGIGIVLVYTLIQPSDSAELDSGLHLIGLNIELVTLSWLVLGVILLVSSIGLWLGRPWGWWSAAYIYLHRLLVSLRALFATLSGAGPSAEGEVGTGYFVVGFLIRIGVSVYVLTYLFHINVRTYSGLSQLAPRRGLLALLGVYVLAVVLIGIARGSLVAGE